MFNREIEKVQNQILDRLSNIERILETNTDVLIKNTGSYKDNKMRELRNIMLKVKPTYRQLDVLSEIVPMFREILEDKESIEKELELLKGEQDGQV